MKLGCQFEWFARWSRNILAAAFVESPRGINSFGAYLYDSLRPIQIDIHGHSEHSCGDDRSFADVLVLYKVSERRVSKGCLRFKDKKQSR